MRAYLPKREDQVDDCMAEAILTSGSIQWRYRRVLVLTPSLERAVGGRIVGIIRNRWLDRNPVPGDKVVQETPYFDCIKERLHGVDVLHVVPVQCLNRSEIQWSPTGRASPFRDVCVRPSTAIVGREHIIRCTVMMTHGASKSPALSVVRSRHFFVLGIQTQGRLFFGFHDVEELEIDVGCSQQFLEAFP